MEIYDDMFEAYERAKACNRVSGTDEYRIRATTDGWAVFRLNEKISFDPAYLAFKNWLRQQAFGSSTAVVKP